MLQNIDSCVNVARICNNTMKKSPTQTVLSIARKRRILRPRDLRKEGIAREYLLRLEKKGDLRRIARGVYELKSAEPTAHHSLAVAAKEVPRGVICLLSALRFHELTTQTPSEVWIGIPVRAWRPKLSSVKHRIVRYSEQTFKAGMHIYEIEEQSVKVFLPAKTIADCFKYRRRIGLDVAIEALKDCLRQRKATVDEIIHYAKICRVANVIKPYLEASV